MPLLEIKLSKKIDTLCSLEESTAIRVEQYAAFVKAPADEVINHALEHVFSKDKEFQAYLEKHSAIPEFSTLRVQNNGSKPGRKSSSAHGN